MSAMTPDTFNRLAEAQLPLAHQLGFYAEAISQGAASVWMPFDDTSLRPGGTISAPAMMSLADFAMYAALLGAIGQVEMAVTTNLNINFPAPAQPGRRHRRMSRLETGQASGGAGSDAAFRRRRRPDRPRHRHLFHSTALSWWCAKVRPPCFETALTRLFSMRIIVIANTTAVRLTERCWL